MIKKCELCLRTINLQTPMMKCICGKVHRMVSDKYVIDFTVARHGHFTMRARSRDEALTIFEKWIRENQKETAQFIDYFTFDCEIKTNYAYLDDV